MFYIRVFFNNMRIEWSQNSEVNSTLLSGFAKHILIVVEEKLFSSMPFSDALYAKLKRAGLDITDLKEKPVTLELAEGTLVSVCQLEAKSSTFAMNTALRSAVKPCWRNTRNVSHWRSAQKNMHHYLPVWPLMSPS
jgi:leucyl aminopeptidase